jgi:DeoR family transcriptional regulator of aga operon
MGKPLIPAQRREWIDNYLSVHKIVRIADLSKALDVSEATVRRDLKWLENEGVLECTYGGAILSRRIQLEPEYTYRAQTHTEEKCQIGLAVADLLRMVTSSL